MSLDIQTDQPVVGVIGAGVMGRGIAQVAAEGGLSVLLFDEHQEASVAAKAFIARMFERQVEKGALSAKQAQDRIALIAIADSLEAVAGADVVIEAIVEDLAVKQALFRRLETNAKPDAILASNTSSLSVTAIASACTHPDRIAGLHFFNPVPLMKLVEVVPGLNTRAEVTTALTALARRLGREPVVSVDSPGFIVNHVGRAYAPEAGRLVGEGIASFFDVDRIMTGAPGFRLGPFALLDLIGSDISVAVMESVWSQYFAEPMYAPGPELKLRVLGGALGVKSGAGWYAYKDGKRQQPALPAAPAVPAPCPPIWLAPRAEMPQWTAELSGVLADAGAQLETGDAPSAAAVIVLTPLGDDLTTLITTSNWDQRRTVAVDMLFGLGGTRTVMVTPATEPDARDAIQGLLAADGAGVAVINDSPGFVAQRIVAHIVNVACQVAGRGIADPNDIDLATKLGLGYPAGPLAWGDQLGPQRVLKILDRLHRFYSDPRYRPSPWLKRRAMLGLSLMTLDHLCAFKRDRSDSD